MSRLRLKSWQPSESGSRLLSWQTSESGSRLSSGSTVVASGGPRVARWASRGASHEVTRSAGCWVSSFPARAPRRSRASLADMAVASPATWQRSSADEPQPSELILRMNSWQPSEASTRPTSRSSVISPCKPRLARSANRGPPDGVVSSASCCVSASPVRALRRRRASLADIAVATSSPRR